MGRGGGGDGEGRGGGGDGEGAGREAAYPQAPLGTERPHDTLVRGVDTRTDETVQIVVTHFPHL